MRTPWGLLMDSTRLWRDYQDFWAGYAKSMKSPWRVHGNVWGTVKYSRSIYMRGYDPLLDYQCIQGLIHHFRKPSLSYFSRVPRATLFKQNLFYSTQIIPARSHPFIKIIQQKHENMVMQVCQKRITKYIYITKWRLKGCFSHWFGVCKASNDPIKERGHVCTYFNMCT